MSTKITLAAELIIQGKTSEQGIITFTNADSKDIEFVYDVRRTILKGAKLTFCKKIKLLIKIWKMLK